MITAKIIVLGRVQGVGFRVFTKKKADELSVFGTVENMNNGNVFIVAMAEKEKLDRFIEFCKKGPISSKVKDITIEYIEESLSYSDFKIIN